MIEISSLFFNKEHELLDVPFKRDYDNLVNLSSNQLEHPSYTALFQEFISNANFDNISKYLYLEPYKCEIADNDNLKSSDHLLLAAGSDILIYMIIDTMGANANQIFIQSPTYMSYFDYTTFKNIKPKIITLNHEPATLDDTRKILNSHEKSLVIITNPNNFTGEIIPVEHIKTILNDAIIKKHYIILDEAYVDFSNTFHLDLLNNYNNLLIIKTLSKSYGFAGLRLATAMSNDAQVIEYLRKTGIEKTVSILSVMFYSFLLKNKSRLNEILNDIVSTRDWFATELEKYFPDAKIIPSKTNFITADLANFELAQNITLHLQKKGYAIKHLKQDNQSTGMIRITISTKAIMASVLNHIKHFINNG